MATSTSLRPPRKGRAVFLSRVHRARGGSHVLAKVPRGILASSVAGFRAISHLGEGLKPIPILLVEMSHDLGARRGLSAVESVAEKAEKVRQCPVRTGAVELLVVSIVTLIVAALRDIDWITRRGSRVVRRRRERLSTRQRPESPASTGRRLELPLHRDHPLSEASHQ